MVASPELCAGLDGRAAPDLAASRAADLPVDTMYEIFLRLPAKLLCRLRAVCRTWRSFLSDPEFAAAHAAAWSRLSSSLATTTAPLRSASPTSWIYPAASSSRRLDGHSVVAMPGLNLVSVTSIADGSFRFVDPATAAAYYVWEGEEPIRCDIADRFLVGQVASTGEYKVLRKVTHSHVGEYGFLYEVCTLSGSRPWWRPAQGPPNTVPLARLKEPVWPLMDLCTS